MTHSKFSFVLSVGLGLMLAWGVSALSKDDIVFPVAELEECANEQQCREYCDDSANIDQCLAFAEQYNLLSSTEIERARKFQNVGGMGPGGCTSEVECRTYCDDISNIEECLAFAEQNGFMDERELEEARRVAEALRQGAQLPGGCTSKDECETYCGDPENMRECIVFAEQAGFISEEELREAKQVLRALDAGVSFPGGCRGKQECDAYCEDPNHMEECVNFGIAAGFVPPEEVEQVRRMIPLMKSGKMPGECRKGKEECEAYCSQDENIEECSTFFVEAGFMTSEDVEMFRKTGGKGPGDCKGREECEAFCNDTANQETCFMFGKEHGLISEEDLKNIEEGTRQMKEGISTAPPEVAECLQERIGAEVLQKIEAGTFMPNPQIGDSMRLCFEEFMPRPEEGFSPQGQFDPRDGRASEDESGAPFQGEFEDRVPEEFRNFIPEDTEGLTPEDLEQIIREQQEQRMEQQIRQQFVPQTQQQSGRAASCAEEGGTWDGSGCRPAVQSEGFFPETRSAQDQQDIQQTQEQVQRQIQQQQLEQQIQEQQRQLQEQLQLLQQQTSPPPPTSTGGSMLDAAGTLLKQFLRR